MTLSTKIKTFLTKKQLGVPHGICLSFTLSTWPHSLSSSATSSSFQLATLRYSGSERRMIPSWVPPLISCQESGGKSRILLQQSLTFSTGFWRLLASQLWQSGTTRWPPCSTSSSPPVVPPSFISWGWRRTGEPQWITLDKNS